MVFDIKNQNGFADLHLHSNCSDGYYSPRDLINLVKEQGLQAMAIVDHDDISGLHDAIQYGAEQGVEVIPGVELSVNYRNYDVHILAYCFDLDNSELVHYLDYFKKERVKRARRIVEELHKLGMPISFDAVLKKAGPGSVGRPHIANVLVDEGYVYSFQDAFNRFLGDGKPASIEKPKIEIQRAVSLIKAAGGVCSIAHPGLMLNDSDLQLLIQAGTNAIEVVHPNHSAEQVRHYSQLARSNGLIETGGSDFHGGRKGEETLGKYKVPYEVVTQLKELARNHR